MEEHL
jgi:hypothetical protein